MSPNPTDPATTRPTARADSGVGLSAVPDEVHSEGLLLRPWRPDDAEAMVQVYDDPEAARWTPVPSPFAVEEARAYLRRAGERRADGFRQLAVVSRCGEVAGEVLLMSTGLPDTCELGHAVAVAHRGRGLARQSLALLLCVAARAGYSRARLRIAVGNRASEKGCQQAGLRARPRRAGREDQKGTTVRVARWSRELTRANRSWIQA